MALGHPLRAAVPAHPLTAARPPRQGRRPVPPRPASRRQREELEAALGHRFADPSLLDEALTHSSVTGRFGRRKRSYERLEFLGDRVLGLVVAHLLFERFPEDPEGRLTDRQVALVQGAAVAEVGERLGLARLLEIARSEAEGEGRGEQSRLADGCEALIGALYLDGGLEAARRFVEREWEPLLERVTTPPRDAKTTLRFQRRLDHRGIVMRHLGQRVFVQGEQQQRFAARQLRRHWQSLRQCHDFTLQDDRHLRANRRRGQWTARYGLPEFDEADAFRRDHRHHRNAELFA